MGNKKHEIWAVSAVAASLLVLLSLLSYHGADPSFLVHSRQPIAPANWVGGFGANLSAALITMFGIASYGIPLSGFWLSLSLMRGRTPSPSGPLQAFGIILLTMSFAGLCALNSATLQLAGESVTAGGYVGETISAVLSGRLYRTGTAILLVAFFIIGVLLATPFTLGAMIRFVRGSAERLVLLLRGLLSKSFKRGAAAPETEASPIRQEARKQPSPHRADPVVVEVLADPPEPTKRKLKKELPAPLPPISTHATTTRYAMPSLELLDAYEEGNHRPDSKVLEQNAATLEEKLGDFGVQGKVSAICPGPVITMYEYVPAPGIKISRIVGLSDDLSMALKAVSIRVVAPIPGKAAIGIEIPNLKRELVSIRTVLQSDAFALAQAPLTIALGNDITGQPVVANLGRMPHLLIAGATGTGKSVGLNAILSSMLYRNSPEMVRMLLIDPKRIELNSYEGIPHLIHPVVTDAKMATRALRWAVQEMELRYKLLASKSVRNIEGYNKALARMKKEEPAPELEADGLKHHRLPYIVIIIDELADLMMVASREVEESITRLAQMARAAGIHLVLATQRPSVDVLTGIIKANIPTRISFQVSSRIDSRTILDNSGAESLLGSGDMLFLPPGTGKLQRIHGAFISDSEVQRLTEFWRTQEIVEDPLGERVDFEEQSTSDDIAEEDLDAKYEEAVELVLETRQASISMVQRRLRVGYNRAARMIEVMEQQGIVSASDGIKPREVLGRK